MPNQLRSASSGFDYVALNTRLLRVSYLFIGYPCYSSELFKDYLRVAQIDKSDLIKLYRLFSPKIPIFRVFWMISSCLVSIKNSIGAMYVLTHVSEYNSYLIDHQLDKIDNTTHRFDCIHTNCTLAASNAVLSNTFNSLPIFTICQPQLKPYFNPLIGVHPHGIIVHCTWTFLLSFLGFITPIFLHFKPQSSDMFLFTAAPQNYRLKLLAKVRHLVQQTSLSQKNYLEFLLYKNERKQTVRFNRVEGLALDQINRQQFDSDKFALFADDCLPLVRTEWWRLTMAKQIFTLILVMMYCFYVIYVGGTIDMDVRINLLHDELLMLLNVTKSNGCSIWVDGEDGFDMDMIARAMPNWNLVTLIETIIVVTPIFIIVSINSVYLAISLKEITAWIAELLDRIRIVSAIVDWCVENLDMDENPTKAQATCAIFSGLKELRKQTLEPWYSIRFSRKLIYGFNEGKIYDELVVYNLMNSCCNSKQTHIESMTKILISIRLLDDYARQSSKDLSFIMAYLYVINYGCILILVFVNIKFGNMSLLPLVFGFAAASSINILIIIASNIQAQSRHLIELMWIVIASNEHFKDVEIRHLRHLWIRLACSLTHNNGITFNVLGLSLSYTSLIELSFMSSSLLMLVFH